MAAAATRGPVTTATTATKRKRPRDWLSVHTDAYKKPFAAINALLEAVWKETQDRVRMHVGVRCDLHLDPRRYSATRLLEAEDREYRARMARQHIEAIRSDATREWMLAATRTIVDCSTNDWLFPRCCRESSRIKVTVDADSPRGPQIVFNSEFLHDATQCERCLEDFGLALFVPHVRSQEIARVCIVSHEIKFHWFAWRSCEDYRSAALRSLREHTPICMDVINNIIAQYL